MIPRVLIDTAPIPNGGGELRLIQRGDEFSIMLGANELMNSRVNGSESALGTLSCEKIRDTQRPHLLIGGLGMGFTLRAVLAELDGDAQVVVAELVPAVVAWARGPMMEIFGTCLSDSRVSVHEVNVGTLIGSHRAFFDAILLDVDNGPDGLTHKANEALYSENGLRAAYNALRPGGVLAVWSAGPDRGFSHRLKRAGYSVQEVKVRANGGRGARHIIWLASKNKDSGATTI